MLPVMAMFRIPDILTFDREETEEVKLGVVPDYTFITFLRSSGSSDIVAIFGGGAGVSHEIAITNIFGVFNHKRIFAIFGIRDSIAGAINCSPNKGITPRLFENKIRESFFGPLRAREGIQTIILENSFIFFLAVLPVLKMIEFSRIIVW